MLAGRKRSDMKNAAERKFITIKHLIAVLPPQTASEDATDARSLMLTVHSRTVRGLCSRNHQAQKQNQLRPDKSPVVRPHTLLTQALLTQALLTHAPACAGYFLNAFSQKLTES